MAIDIPLSASPLVQSFYEGVIDFDDVSSRITSAYRRAVEFRRAAVDIMPGIAHSCMFVGFALAATSHVKTGLAVGVAGKVGTIFYERKIRQQEEILSDAIRAGDEETAFRAMLTWGEPVQRNPIPGNDLINVCLDQNCHTLAAVLSKATLVGYTNPVPFFNPNIDANRIAMILQVCKTDFSTDCQINRVVSPLAALASIPQERSGLSFEDILSRASERSDEIISTFQENIDNHEGDEAKNAYLYHLLYEYRIHVLAEEIPSLREKFEALEHVAN